MSPIIIDIQRRLAEAGRIRAGEQVRTGTTRKDGKPSTRPAKLQAWRFTSRNARALEAVASLYGGEVRPWQDAPTGDQYELYSEAAEIDVILPPEQVSFSQWLEEWSGGGCKHRCDGVFDEVANGPCSCDPDRPLCEPHTRLSTMLAGIPTTGLWRVETKGHYAKSELLGAMEMANLLTTTTGRAVLPAKLRLEHRKVIRDGKTKQFDVPVLDFAVDMAALAAGVAPSVALHSARDAPAALPAAPASPVTPVPARPAPPLAEQIASVQDAPTGKPRKNAPPPIPRTGLAPRTASQAEAGTVPARESMDPSPGPADPGPEPDPQPEPEQEQLGLGGTPPPPPPAPTPSSPPRRRRRTAAEPEGDAETPQRKPGCITPRRAQEVVEAAELVFPGCARETRLIFAADVVGHPVESFLDLTPQEANKVVRALNAERQKDADELGDEDEEEPL